MKKLLLLLLCVPLMFSCGENQKEEEAQREAQEYSDWKQKQQLLNLNNEFNQSLSKQLSVETFKEDSNFKEWIINRRFKDTLEVDSTDNLQKITTNRGMISKMQLNTNDLSNINISTLQRYINKNRLTNDSINLKDSTMTEQ